MSKAPTKGRANLLPKGEGGLRSKPDEGLRPIKERKNVTPHPASFAGHPLPLGEGAQSAVQTLIVTEDEDGLRLDRWFKRRLPTLSLSHLNKIVRTGQVRVDGARAKARNQ